MSIEQPNSSVCIAFALEKVNVERNSADYWCLRMKSSLEIMNYSRIIYLVRFSIHSELLG